MHRNFGLGPEYLDSLITQTAGGKRSLYFSLKLAQQKILRLVGYFGAARRNFSKYDFGTARHENGELYQIITIGAAVALLCHAERAH